MSTKTSVQEELNRFPKAVSDSLYLVRCVDGGQYLALRDDGGYIEPLTVYPQRSAEDPEQLIFALGMSYFFQSLTNEVETNQAPRIQIGIRDEHVMAFAKANDNAKLLYFQTRESILTRMMERSGMKRAEAAAADDLLREAAEAAGGPEPEATSADDTVKQ